MDRTPQPDPTGSHAWELLEELARTSPPDPTDLDGVDEPVARYLRHAAGERPQPSPAVQLEMRGRIKIGRWLPFKASQLLAPRLGTVWRATVARHHEIEVTFAVDDHEVTLHHRIDDQGRLRSSTFQRWGDPDRTGAWERHPFGVEVHGEGTFGDLTIPTRGSAGWHFGTDRWDRGAFFEFEITRLDLLP